MMVDGKEDGVGRSPSPSAPGRSAALRAEPASQSQAKPAAANAWTQPPLEVRLEGTLTGISAEVGQWFTDPEGSEPWFRELCETVCVFVRRADAYEGVEWKDYAEAPEQYEPTDDSAEIIAFAHLIAAAPALYEALASLLTAVEFVRAFRGPKGEELLAKANAALSLARGES